MSAVLERTAFTTSRELEFFSEKELRQQIGLDKAYWPLAIVRELVDNALDVADEIDVTIEDDRIVVHDNGPGIPRDTLIQSMNYMVRVSDKANYVSPTRGAMGNALKVIWAAPFVLTGEAKFEVEANGERHHVDVTLDRIEQRPRITHTSEDAIVKNGTKFTIHWRDSTRQLMDGRSTGILQADELVDGYAAFNPDATLTLNGDRIERTTTDWKKWRTNDPTPAHWYTVDTLRDLIAAYVSAERNGAEPRTVRSFVSEFKGLSSTAKQKSVGWTCKYLHDFVKDNGIDPEFVEKLLERMKANSKAPKPTALGVIGREHLTAWMLRNGAYEPSIKYKRFTGEDDGIPYVIEAAFGIHQHDGPRRMLTGLNWSPVIHGYPDPALADVLAEMRVEPHDPITMAIHIARARFDFADRGKTRTV